MHSFAERCLKDGGWLFHNDLFAILDIYPPWQILEPLGSSADDSAIDGINVGRIMGVYSLAVGDAFNACNTTVE